MMIWQTRKRSQATNSIEYNIITVDNTALTEPQGTIEHIAKYTQKPILS